MVICHLSFHFSCSCCIVIIFTRTNAAYFRTGSKLGISPLMLAAMNGHTAAVKLLLDMGSDINAQVNAL